MSISLKAGGTALCCQPHAGIVRQYLQEALLTVSSQPDIVRGSSGLAPRLFLIPELSLMVLQKRGGDPLLLNPALFNGEDLIVKKEPSRQCSQTREHELTSCHRFLEL